jgi:hypothetical protein
MDALRRLAAQEPGSTVANRSADFLQRSTNYQHRRVADVAKNVRIVQPPGRSLPRTFLETDWDGAQRRSELPGCLLVNGDGVAEIVIVDAVQAVVLIERPSSWTYFGQFGGVHCRGVREALLAGRLEQVPVTVCSGFDCARLRLHLNLPSSCPGR